MKIYVKSPYQDRLQKQLQILSSVHVKREYWFERANYFVWTNDTQENIDSAWDQCRKYDYISRKELSVFKQLKSEERQWIADKKNEMMIKKYNKSGGRKKRSLKKEKHSRK